MKMLLCFIVTLCAYSSVDATIILPEVLSDNMVLQQNSVVKLWGTSTIKKSIRVRVSWTTTVFSCSSKQDGTWELSIFTPKGSFDKHRISISDGIPLLLENILIGEVWFCAGQSNMAMTLNGYRNEPIAQAQETISAANEDSGIRMFNAEKTASYALISPAKGKWLTSSPKNLPGFSALGYFYAVQLQKTLQVPIGIINSSYGGSTIEGWLNQGTVEKYSGGKTTQQVPDSMRHMRPCVMFQGMLKPYRDYRVKGFLWYQGEGNIGMSATYAQKLQDLVYLWRFTFDDKDLPFYAVEIAPFNYGSISEPAKIREAAYVATHTVLRAGMITTNDLVPEIESNSIHPSNKQTIGERLGNLALLETYQFDSIRAYSPSFDRFEVIGDSLILYFNHCYNGLLQIGEITGFELGDAQHVFHPTTAKIGANKNTVVIPLKKEHPFYTVRYCFKNYQVGNVKNSVGLPLFPFRTDDWLE